MPSRPAVADRMAQDDQHTGGVVTVGFVDQYGASRQQVAVAFQRQVEQRIEQRMARGHQAACGWPGTCSLSKQMRR